MFLSMLLKTLMVVLLLMVFLIGGLELAHPSLKKKLNVSASFSDALLLICGTGAMLFIYFAGVQSKPVLVWSTITLFAIFFGALWAVSRTTPVTLNIRSTMLPNMTVNVQQHWDGHLKCWQMQDPDKAPLTWELVMPFFGLRAHFRVYLPNGTMVKVPIGEGMFIQLEDGTTMHAQRDRDVDMTFMNIT